jgi:hypothetical protein
VLTTAHLIHTNDPPDTSSDVWIDEAHYDSKANVSRCVYELSVYILGHEQWLIRLSYRSSAT